MLGVNVGLSVDVHVFVGVITGDLVNVDCGVSVDGKFITLGVSTIKGLQAVRINKNMNMPQAKQIR